MRRTLTIASFIVAVALTCPAEAETGYRQPQYVEALLQDDVGRMMSVRSEDWVKGEDEARLFFRVHRDPEVQKLDPMSRAMIFELEKRELHHAHQRIFRTAYVLALAHTLSKRCPFLEERVARGIRASLMGMVEWIEAKPEQSSSDGTRDQADAERRGQIPLARAISAGENDASTLVRQAGCADVTIARVQSSLKVLTSYVGGADRGVPDIAPDYAHMLQSAGRYLRHDLQHDFGEAALGSRASVRHLPDVDEAIPGVLVGWMTDARAALEASIKDGKNLLLFFFENACYPCSAEVHELIASPAFNALSGQFRAVLLMGDRTKPNEIEPLAQKFGVGARPETLLVKLVGDEATVLERIEGYNEGRGSAERLADRIGAALGVKPTIDREAWEKTAAVRNMMPAACWKIESYPLCMMRIRRTG